MSGHVTDIVQDDHGYYTYRGRTASDLRHIATALDQMNAGQDQLVRGVLTRHSSVLELREFGASARYLGMSHA
jgi:hypothetical protein